MDTRLSDTFTNNQQAREARELLRSCVHCGFCTATCPTYQLLGDELDGPRGRIYLIRQMLEEGQASANTRIHLDRCLLCRSCETTCPSGVQYHRLLHIGRNLTQACQPPPLRQRLLAQLLRSSLPYRKRMGLLLGLARLTRPLLPAFLKQKIPQSVPRKPPLAVTPQRRVLLFQGCVQSATAGNINRATERVLARLGIAGIKVSGEQCCGAVHHHLDAEEKARTLARHNLDQWLPLLQEGAEALVVTASACALEIREYPQLFAHEPVYHQKALELQQHCQEIGTYLLRQNIEQLEVSRPSAIAFHAPCTLQHGLGTDHHARELLSRLGVEVREPADRHLCCGSAGTYSLLQLELSDKLRQDKLEKLQQTGASIITSANIGCLLHLQEKADRPVKHWIEWLDEALEQ